MVCFLYTGKQYTREENFMLTKTQMQQIQDLKLMGYTKTDIIRYYCLVHNKNTQNCRGASSKLQREFPQ